jgi:hypothetical protein
MSIALGRASQTSQVETSQASAPGELLLDETMRVRALPPAEQPRDRRGPMRPAALTPTRSRLTGWMLGAIFRIGDAVALGWLAVAAAPLAAGRLAPSSLTPFIVGSVALLWGLSTIHAYAFAQREALGQHLVKVAAGFGLAALGLEFLMLGFRPTVAEGPFAIWFVASFATLYGLHSFWWAMVRR